MVRLVISMTMVIGLSGCPGLRTSTSTAEKSRRSTPEAAPERPQDPAADPQSSADTASADGVVPTLPVPATESGASDSADVSDADSDTVTIDLGKGVTMEFVRIPAGEFIMGSSDPEADHDEMPAHDVQISRSFYLARTEVTQAQWGALMSGHGSKPRGDDLPVNNVSHEFAVAYCTVASDAAKRVFRLPTEAEWEYACRAGSQAAYGFGDDEDMLGDYAWFEDNSGNQPQPVARLKPNAWGLYDMHGNVAEWCSDWYDSVYYDAISMMDPRGPEKGANRVIRGGSWYLGPWPCRASYRSKSASNEKSPLVGFRLVLEP